MVAMLIGCGLRRRELRALTSAFFEVMNVLHDVRPDIGEFQLRLLLTDAIGILRFLLRTARHRP